MNLGELKAFIGDKPHHSKAERPDQAIQKQLREAGLRQAYAGVSDSGTFSTSLISSQTSVGLRVYNHSLNQNLIINEHKAKLPQPEGAEENKEKSKSLFDFEEIAKNVLHFVGGAIKHAKAKGADDSALLDMFEQARSGVLKGIDMAKKDLGGMLNEEISSGITRSKELIDQGIQNLENYIFEKTEVEGPEDNQLSVSQTSAYSREDSGDLQIRTRDGDQVSIRFEDLEQFQLNRQLIVNVKPPAEALKNEPDKVESSLADSKSSEVSNSNNSDEPVAAETNVTNNTQQQQPGTEQIKVDPNNKADPNSVEVNQSYMHFQQHGLSFSIKGELDEQEIKAISDLVGNANELADEFFNGDIESAYQQALDLGFDDKELTGFALQLTRREQVQVIQTYESVSHFNEDTQSANPTKAAKPVAQYLDHMLEVLEQARVTLQDSNSYENLVNGLINQMGEVHTPDLVHAINRFHAFNNKLLNSLPASLQQEA